MRTLTVSELNEYVRLSLEADPLLQGVTLVGEVSGWRKYPSGHAYFTLKDVGSALSAVMFAQYQRDGFAPTNGQLVEATGSPSVYVREGRYQFYVRRMKPAGTGALFIAFEQLKKKLEDEGLFDPARKRKPPFLPRCVGVVTSGHGAAVRDVINVVGRRLPVADILVCPCAVQGEASGPDIARAIDWMNAYGRADVLIVGRGGGSAEDLWGFNTEVVARAVASSRIPVISAVGHETDFTICDMAVDLRAPTPSAGAELAVPVWDDLIAAARDLQARCAAAARETVEDAHGQLLTYLAGRGMGRAGAMLENDRLRARMAAQRLSAAQNEHVLARSHEAALLQERLNALDPRRALQRGYAIVTDADGSAVPEAARLSAPDVTITWRDGSRRAVVSGMEKETKKT